MKLGKLMSETPYTLVRGSLDKEITTLVYDTRQMVEGALFIAIVGNRFDAHTALAEMAEKGMAAAAITHEWEELPEDIRKVLEEKDVAVVKTADNRKALSSLSVTFFDHPMEKMTVTGFTGTKGKTTSTHMLMYILQAAGKKVGLIGTNGIKIGGEFYRTRYTTPEAFEVQKYAALMVERGCTDLIMEVSSTGLKYGRVEGIFYDYGVFTNLSPDHIGTAEHPDFEDYRASKALLFKRCRVGFFNLDDENCGELRKGSTCENVTYGADPAADYRLADVSYRQKNGTLGCEVRVSGKAELSFFVGMPGYFNAQNALAAAALALRMGISPEAIDAGLSTAKVDGRMEPVYSSEDFTVLVDYAHNGLSSRILLDTLRSYEPKRLVVVFGSGGNRDPHRRYEMGEACGSKADLSIVTEDNSRFEPVENIIRDIHIGLDPTGGAYIDIPDRRSAIYYAIEHAEKGDIIAVIGKGHEDYQETNGVRHHFLDREEIENALKKRGLLG